MDQTLSKIQVYSKDLCIHDKNYEIDFDCIENIDVYWDDFGDDDFEELMNSITSSKNIVMRIGNGDKPCKLTERSLEYLEKNRKYVDTYYFGFKFGGKTFTNRSTNHLGRDAYLLSIRNYRQCVP
jgi:hypothetical protein